MNEIHKTMGARKELRMEERKYLKWYNKVGYGSGDLAANCIYGLLTSFVMIYLTDTVGLNAGIIGTLIMFSKFADGINRRLLWKPDRQDKEQKWGKRARGCCMRRSVTVSVLSQYLQFRQVLERPHSMLISLLPTHC